MSGEHLWQPGKTKTGGRVKGTPNKASKTIKEMVILALEKAGDGNGVAYLAQMAKEQPVAFLGLVGRILPLQLENSNDNPVTITQVVHLVVDTREQAEKVIEIPSRKGLDPKEPH